MLTICFSSMLIMEFLPKIPLKLFKVVPSSLIAIISSIILEFAVVRPLGHRTDVIRDVSEFTSDTAIPWPFFVKTDTVNYDLSSITTSAGMQQIFVQGLLLCIVGCIESLMTSEVVEDFTKTPGNGDRTVLAMGVGNILSGFCGGMGGNAMIGLSTVNCLNGGRGRLGPAVTALGVVACVVGAYPLLNFIPVAALTGIMLVVVMHTFKWFSLTILAASVLPLSIRKRLGPRFQRKVPRVEVAVIFVVTILSNFPKGTNIAYAVAVGVSLCAINYAWNSSKTFEWQESFGEDGTKYYDISGPLFFGATNRFLKVMNPDTDPEKVEVRFSSSTSIMDYSAMEGLHKIAVSYTAKGKSVRFQSLCPASEKMISKANQLVKSIEYTSRSISVDVVPGIAPLPEECGFETVGEN